MNRINYARPTVALGVFCFALLLTAAARGQSEPTAAQRGSDLFAQGKYDEAIVYLKRATKENAEDFTAWHTLGLSYFSTNHLKEAQTAFERATKLKPDSAATHVNLAYVHLLRDKLDNARKEATSALSFDPANATAHYVLAAVASRSDKPDLAITEASEALRLKPGMGPALLVKSEASLELYYRGLENKVPADRRLVFLDGAIGALDQFLRENKTEPGTESWQDQLVALRLERQRYGKTDLQGLEQIFTTSTVHVKAKIIQKPPPEYPAAERDSGVSGTVRLRAVFTSTGRVTAILLLNNPSQALSRAAIEAARRIKFKPATVNGKPVSQYIILEYNFSIF